MMYFSGLSDHILKFQINVFQDLHKKSKSDHFGQRWDKRVLSLDDHGLAVISQVVFQLNLITFSWSTSALLICEY